MKNDPQENTMSRTLVALGLLAIAGAPLMSTAHAGGAFDPHQRARELIAPSFAGLPAPNAGAAWSSEPAESADAHARARNRIRDERAASALPPAGYVGAGLATGYSDPHRRIRSIILGRDD
jgi:hypothetical protein